MHDLRALLDALPVPPPASPGGAGYRLPSAHLLGAELPQGHLHVWSAPPSAGKTAFLLGLGLDAARRGRGVLLATYDLPASTLALRLLAMESGVPLAEIDAGSFSPPSVAALAAARARLSVLPLTILEARGLTAESLDDRLVRAPRRVDVLGVDYVEAVVRAPGSPLAASFRDLSAIAQRRWVAVVAIARAAPSDLHIPEGSAPADRVGWIEPAGASGGCEATILSNRHGPRASCQIRLDAASARWLAD
jgi:hypothetical protein